MDYMMDSELRKLLRMGYGDDDAYYDGDDVDVDDLVRGIEAGEGWSWTDMEEVELCGIEDCFDFIPGSGRKSGCSGHPHFSVVA